MSKLKYIGKPIAPIDAVDKVTGKLKYAIDREIPGMAYGKILRSQYAHAEIIKIDSSAAEALSGVYGVLTHKDVPQKEWHGCWFNYIGISLDGHPRFYLDDIAVVVAETKELAEKAAELVKVEYKELPAVFTLDDSKAPGAPKIKANGDNCREPHVDEWGDVSKGPEESDYITEIDIKYASQHYASIGRNAAIAEWEGDKVTVYTATQTPSELSDGLAEALDIPSSKVRVVGVPGGSSMGFFWSNNFMMLAALAARKFNVPVKIDLDNEECFTSIKRRHAEHTVGKMGCDKEGRIVFIEVDDDFDLGGYCWKDEVGCFGVDLWGARAKHGRININPIQTNLVTAGCMRGVGDLTLTNAIERMADTLAAKVGLDPVEFRLRNQIRAGDEFRYFPTKFMFGTDGLLGYEKGLAVLSEEEKANWPKFMHLLSSDSIEILTEGAKAFKWKERWKGWGVPSKANGCVKTGIGVGTGIHTNGFELEGGVNAVVRVNFDGSAVVHCSVGRMGNNAETTQMQIMAEELGLPIEMCSARAGDTETAPWAHGSLASNSAFRTGWATRQAAKDAKRQILEIAANQFFNNCSPSDLTMEEGIIFDTTGKSDEKYTLKEVLHHLCTDTLAHTGSITGRTFGRMPPSVHFGRQFAAQFAEVEVDTETGVIKMTDYLCMQNSGTVLNSLVMKNQVSGGAQTGLGYALMEEMIFDYEKGKLLNPSFTDYKVLRMSDFPAANMDVKFVETECPVGPFGARGVSESPIAASVPAISQAVFNAIGVWVDLPMTPERVLKALGKI